jgi:hypothetical protein
MGDIKDIKCADEIRIDSKELYKDFNKLTKSCKIMIKTASPCPNCRGCKLQNAIECTQYKLFNYLELFYKSVVDRNIKMYSLLTTKIDFIGIETINKYDELIKEYPEIFQEQDYINACNQLTRNIKLTKTFINVINLFKKHIFHHK